jgi:type I restriction enzyme S subunit
MSVARHGSFKDSGISWLGAVPAYWSIKKFRHLFRESSEKIEEEVIGPMLSVSGYRGIEIKEYEDDNQRRRDEDLVGYRIVRQGQLVVNTMWLNYAGLGVSAFEGHVSPAYRCYWVADSLDKRFIHHLMRSGIYVKGYTRLLTGVRPNSLQMSREDLMNFPILFPPLEEQCQIASFLDQETSKIDALITEQQRLIELLKEKRQAVISHAVTKGLNPDVRMKPSGVEWLGEVPEHWEVRPLKGLARLYGRIGFRGYTTEDMVDEGAGAVTLSPSNMTEAGMVFEKCAYISWEKYYESPEIMIKPDDVLMVKTGSTLGKVAYVPATDRDMTVNPQIMVFKDIKCSPKFLFYFLQTPYVQSSVKIKNAGSTIPTITQESIGNFIMTFPSVEEQEAIVSYVDEETRRLNQLTEEAVKGIALLQERRTALISAAVTGKIDVRNYASTQKDAA